MPKVRKRKKAGVGNTKPRSCLFCGDPMARFSLKDDKYCIICSQAVPDEWLHNPTLIKERQFARCIVLSARHALIESGLVVPF